MSGLSIQGQQALQTALADVTQQRPDIQQAGSRDGQRVVVQNSGSDGVRSQDLEELSMSIASKRERKDVDKQGPKRLEAQSSRQIEAVQKINEQLEKLPDFDKQSVQRLVQMLKRDPPKNDEELQRKLGGFHEDITYQQTALGIAADQLQGEGDAPDLLQLINRQIAKNEREFGQEIRAGYNVTPTALAAGKGDAALVQELRGSYRENILSYQGARQTLANLLASVNKNESLEGRIKFLLDAISSELNAQGPSIEKRYLQAIRDEIFQLVSLNSMRGGLKRAIDRYVKRFGRIRIKKRRRLSRRQQSENNEDDEPENPIDWLLLAMLEMAETKFVSAKNVSDKTDLLSPPDIEAEIYLLREMWEFSRGMPIKIYPSQDHRSRLVDACQQALDEAIEKEEELEEE